MTTKEAKESILSIQVDAALAGHDLTVKPKGDILLTSGEFDLICYPFEPVEVLTGGYEARCRRCNQSSWVGDSGLMYSLLGDECEDKKAPVG